MAQGDLVISADFGTSGVKVGVVDSSLEILARATETYPLSLAPGGVAEQIPDDWWSALVRALAQLRSEMPDLQKRAAALVICGQICGVICTDANGTPLRPCLTWMDKRAAEEGQKLVGGWPAVHGYRPDKALLWLRLTNGAPAHNGMDPIAKMLWIKAHEPEIFVQTRWFMDARDWLVHRATGEVTTCPESANLTWIMDTRSGREGWSPRLTRRAGIPREKLPRIVQGTDAIGDLTPQAAAELGLRGDVQVLGGAADVTAATLGTGAVADGELHVSIATSAWIAGFFDGRRLSVPHSYATITSALGFRPLLIASQENAGSAMDWASAVTRDSGVGTEPVRPDDPFFLPWLTGERVPVDDTRLRGTFHGLSLHHDAAALRRSAAEGVALNLRWAYGKVLREKGAWRDGPVALAGGTAQDPGFAQMIADALNRDVVVGEARHTGMLGAATLAAPFMGWAERAEDAAAQLKSRVTASYHPKPDGVALMQDRAGRLNNLRGDVIRSYGR